MKKLVHIILILFIPFLLKAQLNWGRPYFEAGVLVGTSNYSGELVNTIVDVKHMHLAFGAFARYNMNKFLTFRLQGAYGTISGNDKDSKAERDLIRNLHFRSQIVEFGLIGEFNLMGFSPVGNNRMFSPYAFMGFSVFNFNPKAQHFDPRQDGIWMPLQPLNTEGQGSSEYPNRNPYALTQISIPLGLGIKYAINSHVNLGFEIGFRKTFTDYLDDVANTYPVSRLGESLYDQTPYVDGEYNIGNYTVDAGGNEVFVPVRSLSYQELMADGTFLYLMNQSGTTNVDINEYEAAKLKRLGNQRGDRGLDWYLITGITLSYNFTDEGLSGSGFRQKRRKKAGCKSAQF
jgi:hypothetical protein